MTYEENTWNEISQEEIVPAAQIKVHFLTPLPHSRGVSKKMSRENKNDEWKTQFKHAHSSVGRLLDFVRKT